MTQMDETGASDIINLHLVLLVLALAPFHTEPKLRIVIASDVTNTVTLSRLSSNAGLHKERQAHSPLHLIWVGGPWWDRKNGIIRHELKPTWLIPLGTCCQIPRCLTDIS